MCSSKDRSRELGVLGPEVGSKMVLQLMEVFRSQERSFVPRDKLEERRERLEPPQEMLCTPVEHWRSEDTVAERWAVLLGYC